MMSYVEPDPKPDEPVLNKILDFIHNYKGIDLSQYRQNFLFRRLRLRIQATKCQEQLDYIKLLRERPEEYDRFLDALSINVTEFFRDPEVFEAFGKTALSEIIARKEAMRHRIIRIWSAGCASGEEPYSIAILAKEATRDKPGFVIKILATDIDDDALERAKKGEYPQKELAKVNPGILNKYFIRPDNECYRVKDDVRQMVRFENCNLKDDPPYKFLDAIFCRNVLIYLSRQQKEALYHKFYRLLNLRGYLVLSKVETLWERNLFNTILPKEKIYQKAD